MNWEPKEGDEFIFIGDKHDYKGEFVDKMEGKWIFKDYVEYDMVTAFAVLQKPGESPYTLSIDYNNFREDFERPYRVRKGKIDKIVGDS